METPCIQKCRLEYDMCVSCGRTRRQITEWKGYSDKQREHIMKMLKEPKYVELS